MIGKALVGAGIGIGAFGVPYCVGMVHRIQDRAEDAAYLYDAGYISPSGDLVTSALALNPFDKDDIIRIKRCNDLAFRVGEVAGSRIVEVVDHPEYGTQAISPEQFRFLCP